MLTILALALFEQSFSQVRTLINKEWITNTGIADTIPITSSCTDNNGHLIITTNVSTANQHADLLISKLDKLGNIIWENTYNGISNSTDFGTAVCIDQNNNVIVVGATFNAASNYDFVIIKYDTDGNLIWTQTFNGAGNNYDVPTAVITDINDNIFVIGASMGGASLTDYLTLKLDYAGNIIWHSSYNYANLYEIPTGIVIDNSGNVIVSGASASSFNNWDYAIVEYDSAGTQQNDYRQNVTGAGFDKPTGFKRDINGNLFLTGIAFNPSNNSYDGKTMMLDANLIPQWIDYTGDNLQVASNCIEIDGQGNSYVAGYISTSSQGKNYWITKYDISGTIIWTRTSDLSGNRTDDEILNITITQSKIVATAEISDGNNSQIVTLFFDETGKIIGQENYAGSTTGKNSPRSITHDAVGNFYLSGVGFDGAQKNNIVIKYSSETLPISVVSDTTGNPLYVKNTLMVKVNHNEVKHSAINRRGFNYGKPSDFFSDSLQARLETVLGNSYKSLLIRKALRDFTVEDTISKTRLDDVVNIGIHWNNFVFMFRENIDEAATIDTLKSLTNDVIYANYDPLFQFFASANDDFYINGKQGSLSYSSILSSNQNAGNINVTGAWNYTSGDSRIKVGVYDSGIEFGHGDYADSSSPTGSRVKGGRIFPANSDILSSPNNDVNGHGTSTSSIIGAVRNNNLQIAGIAGGGGDGFYGFSNNDGVSLYGMNIDSILGGVIEATDIHEAIFSGAFESVNGSVGFGLNIMNNSWGDKETGFNNTDFLRIAIQIANIVGVTFAASSGNYSNLFLNDNSGPIKTLPSSYPDCMVLKVGGCNSAGNYDQGAVIGHNLDLVGPYEELENYNTALKIGNSTRTFGGTSSACPHVAGVAALMLSFYNTHPNKPNNLANEDIEKILQMTARDVTAPNPNFPTSIGYDEPTGYGIVDATKALEAIDLACKKIVHRDVIINQSDVTIVSGNMQIIVQQDWNTVDGGFYNAMVFKVTVPIDLSVDNNYTLQTAWARQNRSIPWGSFVPNNPFFANPMQECEIDFVNNTITGYYYFLVTDIFNHPVSKWLPQEPNFGNDKISYSVYSSKCGVQLGNNELNTNYGITLSPNPSSNQIVISHTNNKIITDVKIHDLEGRTVYNQINNNSNRVLIDTQNFSNGMYFAEVFSEENRNSKKIKFIVQH